MDRRGVQSVSCLGRRRVRSKGGRPISPPIEQENPFVKVFKNMKKAETNPGTKSLAVHRIIKGILS